MEKVLLSDEFVVNGKKVFKTNVPIKRLGRGQYASVIFWWHWSFSDEFKKVYFPESLEKVEGINIVPYRFSEGDITCPFLNKDHCFREECLKDTSYVDYDKKTGNYHKIPDGVFQVVITRGPSGPTFIPNKTPGTLEATRVDHYFPAINEDNRDDTNDIKELIWMAINWLIKE